MADFETLFRALQQVDARYVVVGGVAAVLHGHACLTPAVELVVDLEPSAAEKVVLILESLGFQPRERWCAKKRFLPDEFADPEFRERWLRDGKPPVFSMWDSDDPRWTVDLLVDPPIVYADLSSRSEPMELRTTSVPVAALEGGAAGVEEAVSGAPMRRERRWRRNGSGSWKRTAEPSRGTMGSTARRGQKPAATHRTQRGGPSDAAISYRSPAAGSSDTSTSHRINRHGSWEATSLHRLWSVGRSVGCANIPPTL